MATIRMVKTVIWEDEWFIELSDKAQKLYMYLITNKNTEISGIYRLPLREMSMYTKYSEDALGKLLKELYPKIAYVDGWVIIPNYPKHQNVANNAKVKLSIEKYMKNVPADILKVKSEIINHKSEAIDSLSIPYPKKSEKTDKKAENKGIYGEFKKVKLTDDEYAKLGDKLGTNRETMIEELDTGIESKGYRYKSHYATILSWARRKGIGVTSKTKSKYDLS